MILSIITTLFNSKSFKILKYGLFILGLIGIFFYVYNYCVNDKKEYINKINILNNQIVMLNNNILFLENNITNQKKSCKEQLLSQKIKIIKTNTINAIEQLNDNIILIPEDSIHNQNYTTKSKKNNQDVFSYKMNFKPNEIDKYDRLVLKIKEW